MHETDRNEADPQYRDVDYYSPVNDYVWSRTIAAVGKGVGDLEDIKMTNFQNEYLDRQKENLAKKKRE